MRNEIRPNVIIQRFRDKVMEGSVGEVGNPGEWRCRISQSMKLKENRVGVEVRNAVSLARVNSRAVCGPPCKLIHGKQHLFGKLCGHFGLERSLRLIVGNAAENI